MRLTSKESNILACVALRADLPIAQIRKETGYRDHTIRYAIKRMEERGVIRQMPFINLPALGFTLHNVFFSLGSENKGLRKTVLKELQNAPQVSWVAEMGAEFQFGIELIDRSVHEVHGLLNQLSMKLGNIFFQKSVTSQFSATLLPRGYLSSKAFKAKPLSTKSIFPPVDADDLDHRILAALSQHGSESHRRIAAMMSIPLSTLELRIRKLTAAGVLLGQYYIVDVSKFQVQTFKLLIYTKAINPQFAKKLFAFSFHHPNIVFFLECFGSWDFELTVEVMEPEEVVNITQEIYEEFGTDLQTIKVLSKFRDVKWLPYPANLGSIS